MQEGGGEQNMVRADQDRVPLRGMNDAERGFIPRPAHVSSVLIVSTCTRLAGSKMPFEYSRPERMNPPLLGMNDVGDWAQRPITVYVFLLLLYRCTKVLS